MAVGDEMIFLFLLLALRGYAQTNHSTVETTLRFMAIADWGGIPIFPYKTFVEVAVGDEMAYLASKLGVDFIIALGDNFYFDGVENVDDHRFSQTFESAYHAPSLQVPWFLVAGNHDHYGNVTAQIMYSTRSERWHFPDFYYKKSFVIPHSNFTIDLLMLDTVILCGNVDRNDLYSPPVLQLPNIQNSESQWEWLESNLNESRYVDLDSLIHLFTEQTANYLIVGGHFPVYSIAEHGSTTCLVNRLIPMLEKYNVTAYFSGHDHNMQHIQVQNSSRTMDYFVSGSSNFIDPSRKNIGSIPEGSLMFSWANPFSLGAFLSVEISELNMTVSFIQSLGKVMYKYAKLPRHEE